MPRPLPHSPCPPGALKSKISAHHKVNWVEEQGGLPRYIERIACHLHFDQGMEVGHAIAVAVNMCKRMCATGTTNISKSVNAGSRSEACAAIAQWEKMRAASHAESGAKRAVGG